MLVTGKWEGPEVWMWCCPLWVRPSISPCSVRGRPTLNSPLAMKRANSSLSFTIMHTLSTSAFTCLYLASLSMLFVSSSRSLNSLISRSLLLSPTFSNNFLFKLSYVHPSSSTKSTTCSLTLGVSLDSKILLYWARLTPSLSGLPPSP